MCTKVCSIREYMFILRSLAALPENPSSVLSNHVASHSLLQFMWQVTSILLSWPP